MAVTVTVTVTVAGRTTEATETTSGTTATGTTAVHTAKARRRRHRRGPPEEGMGANGTLRLLWAGPDRASQRKHRRDLLRKKGTTGRRHARTNGYFERRV